MGRGGFKGKEKKGGWTEAKTVKEKKEGRLFDDHLFSVQQNPGRGGGRQNKKKKMRVPKRGRKGKIAKKEKVRGNTQEPNKRELIGED